jgi:hypothetical protein
VGDGAGGDGVTVQQWRGYVIEVLPNSFWARFEVVVGEGGDVDAEIRRSQLSAKDNAIISEGMFLDWTITDDDTSVIALDECHHNAPPSIDWIAFYPLDSQENK